MDTNKNVENLIDKLTKELSKKFFKGKEDTMLQVADFLKERLHKEGLSYSLNNLKGMREGMRFVFSGLNSAEKIKAKFDMSDEKLSDKDAVMIPLICIEYLIALEEEKKSEILEKTNL